MDKIEQKICEIIDGKKEEIMAFGRDIFCHAELGYKEVRTSGKFVEEMKKLGLDAETGLAITGVKSYLKPKGSTEGPTLAVIGEMDALPIPNHPDAWSETGASHCCSHNAQLTGVVRGMLPAGLAVTAGMKAGDIDPRCRAEHCFTVSDKARAIGGGVLEGLLYFGRRAGLWSV